MFRLPAWLRAPRPKRRVDQQQEPLTWKQRMEALRLLPRFLRLIWQSQPRLFILSGVMRLLRAGIPLAMLYVGQLIVDEVLRLTRTPNADWQPLAWLVAAELGLALVSDLLLRATSLADALLSDRFTNETSVKLMAHAATLDLDQYEDAAFYDKLERARRQTLNRTLLVTYALSQVQETLTMAFLLAGIVVYNPWLVLLIVVAVVPSFLGESHFNYQSYSLVHSWTPERRELDYLRYTGASDETAKEVKIFGLSQFLIERFRSLSERFYQENRQLSIARAIWGGIFSTVGTLGYYGAYGVIIWQTVNGQLTLGQLVFLSGAFQRLRTILEGSLNRFAQIAENALYLKDFFDFFDLQPRIRRPEEARPYPRPVRQGWQFEDVGFRYQNQSRWALRGVSFHLQPGEKLALVGENGAGKTTLVKLLARLYDPSEGRIRLDGTDLRDYDPADLRARIGVIFQDFVRFQLTAAENLAVGRIEVLDRPDRGTNALQQAARLSLADSVVTRLPKGYEQIVGRRFAGGVDLSGGEWQKIALGRAYLRGEDLLGDNGTDTLARADLLILDEPTAALDARAEHEVFQRFSELTAGRTAVLISHRFSTVRMADRILVLGKPPIPAEATPDPDAGSTVLELGSHAELLQQRGIYAELFDLQARGYR